MSPLWSELVPSTQELESADRAAQSILASPKYNDLCPNLVQRIYLTELRGLLPSYSRRKPRSSLVASAEPIPPDAHDRALNLTRRKLHQTVGAFAPTRVCASMEAAIRSASIDSPQEAQELAVRILAAHPSTRERIPSLEMLYERLNAYTGPVTSVLDLGCGLHPLESPWMKLEPGCRYVALDASARLIRVVNAWLGAMGMEPLARAADVVTDIPSDRFDVAFALKLLPTLEQQGAGLSARLLDSIDARWVVVSYPRATLSGRGVGMGRTYASQFEALADGRPWTVHDLSTRDELVYLIENPTGG